MSKSSLICLFFLASAPFFAAAQTGPGLANRSSFSQSTPSSISPGPNPLERFTLFAGNKRHTPPPILVVDGILWPIDSLVNINPNDIESIGIVKEPAGSVLIGCRTPGCVIIITTRTASLRHFIIKDFLTGQKIPAATICFTSGKDTIMALADEQGELVTDKLKPGKSYDLAISSTGYKTLITVANRKEQVLLLGRDYVNCGELVVSPAHFSRGGRARSICYSLSNGSVEAKTMKTDSSTWVEISEPAGAIYPNPALRGASAWMTCTSPRASAGRLTVLTIEGRMIRSNQLAILEGTNRMQIPVDASWTAGVYLVRLVHANGKLLKQEKLIVQ